MDTLCSLLGCLGPAQITEHLHVLVTAREHHGFCHFLLFGCFCLQAGYYFRLHAGGCWAGGEGGSRGGFDLGQVLESCHT